MIFIIHGDDLPKSRETILQIQQKVKATAKKEINLEEITPTQLKEALTSFDIFSEPPFIVLDISTAGRKNLEEYVQTAEKIPPRANLIILSQKELSKTNAFLKGVNALGAKVLKNSLEPTSNVFKFIDALYAKNKKQTYKELSNLIKDGQEPFYLFSMIVYGLRNLALVRFNSPLVGKMAPFVKMKSQSQTKNFTAAEVLAFYKTFYIIDKKMKTGRIQPELAIPYAIEKVLD